MYKIFFLCLIIFIAPLMECSFSAVLNKSAQDLRVEQVDTEVSQDFYKATVQAYKDFNEQVVRYVSISLAIISTIVTGLVILFVFLFRKTLAEIRKDIKDDADRINDVYSKTFELLNRQADTNLRIFESRETELKETIKEAKELLDNTKDVFAKISEKDSIREPVAEELMNKKFEGAQKELKEIKQEVGSMKKDLEDISGED